MLQKIARIVFPVGLAVMVRVVGDDASATSKAGRATSPSYRPTADSLPGSSILTNPAGRLTLAATPRRGCCASRCFSLGRQP